MSECECWKQLKPGQVINLLTVSPPVCSKCGKVIYKLYPKTKEVGMNWCEHLIFKYSNSAQRNRWFFKPPSMTHAECVADDFKQCPVCLNPKPEKPLKLWEIIAQRANDRHWINLEDEDSGYNPEKDARYIADAVMKAVLEVVDRLKPKDSTVTDGFIRYEELKRRLIELGGE